MSRFRRGFGRFDGTYYRAAPKKPPPAHGIKIKKTGSTWWGRRWIEALERMSEQYSSRLARGKTYARAGRTHDLEIEDGMVTAKVTGSRRSPYEIALTISRLSDAVWSKAIAAMSSKAQFSAQLLLGQMPEEIESAFAEAGASLFPTKSDDLRTDCSCPDWANPCKHVAATHYVLGEALDRDPFLLFELRGRTKDQVLTALREYRAAPDQKKPARRTTKPASPVEIPKVRLGRIRAADYDQPREPFPSLHLTLQPPSLSGATLCQLGTPPGWDSEDSPHELLAPLMEAAAKRARELALADFEDGDKEAIGATEPESRESREQGVSRPPRARSRQRE